MTVQKCKTQADYEIEMHDSREKKTRLQCIAAVGCYVVLYCCEDGY